MPYTLILTRSYDQSLITQHRVQDLLGSAVMCVIVPITRVVPVVPRVGVGDPLLEGAHFFTSPNVALAFAKNPGWVEKLKNQPSYGVGPSTVQSLKDLGFESVQDIGPTVPDMVRHIQRHKADIGYSVTYWRGSRVRHDLKSLLAPYDIRVKEYIVYKVDLTPDAALQAWHEADMPQKKNAPWGVMFCSMGAIEGWAKTFEERPTAWCLSPTLATAAQRHGFQEAWAPDEPRLEDLCRLMARCGIVKLL